MNNIVSFSAYADEYLVYEKKNKLEDKEYKTIIEINKKLIKAYDLALIIKKFNPIDFDINELGEFLFQNEILFKLFLPLKNTKGFYIKHFPRTREYLDHYTADDDFSLREKRPVDHFETIDVFNKRVTGLFG